MELTDTHTRIVIKAGTGGHADYDDNPILIADLGDMKFTPQVGSTIRFEGFLKEFLPTASPYFGQMLLVRHVHQSLYFSDNTRSLGINIEVIPA